jgi:hypothetical protein
VLKIRDPRTFWLTLTVATVAVAWIGQTWSGPAGGAFAFWLVACCVCERMWVRLARGEATLSMASCGNFAALLLLPASQAMAVTALSSVVGEMLFMRKPPRRVAFNAAQSAITVGIAAWMFDALGGDRTRLLEMIGTLQWTPLIGAALAYFFVNSGAVSLAVALSDRIAFASAWKDNFGNAYEFISSGALFSLGVLVAIHYEMAGAGATLFAALPLVLAYAGYRHYLKLRALATPPDQRDRFDRAA